MNLKGVLTALVSYSTLGLAIERGPELHAEPDKKTDIKSQVVEPLKIEIPTNLNKLEEKLVFELIQHRAGFAIGILEDLSRRLKNKELGVNIDLKKTIEGLTKTKDRLWSTLGVSSIPKIELEKLQSFIKDLEKADKLISNLLPKINPSKLNLVQADFDGFNDRWLVGDVEGYLKSDERAKKYIEVLLEKIEKAPVPYVPNFGLTKEKVESIRLTETISDRGSPPLISWIIQARVTSTKQNEQWSEESKKQHGIKSEAKK